MSETHGQKPIKTLDTLVSDIYGKLEGLSEGKPLKIPKDELDKTLNGIRECLLHWSQPSDRNKEFTLRMSNVGRPSRLLWFERKAEKRSAPSPSTQIKFLYGHLLEEILLMLVRLSGHTVTNEQAEVNVDDISGHMDCVIDGEVVDIKTASKFAFNKFQRGTLAEDDGFGYLAQISGYEKAMGTENGGFLVINKESGELCLYRPDELDKPNIEERIKLQKKKVFSDTMPEPCYEPEPHGTKGNMKLPKGCSWCSYKYECYKDSNDGQGLRTFKYSNGLIHLTEVVSEPNVEEIL